MSRCLIACVGNELVADDAVGPKLYQLLRQEELPATVQLVNLATGGLRLLELLNGEDLLLVIDALHTGGTPGQLWLLDWQQLAEAQGPPVTSHDVGLREALEIGRLLYPDKMPKRTLLLGVEGVCFNRLDVAMSEDVAAALPQALAMVLEQIRQVNEEVGDDSVVLRGISYESFDCNHQLKGGRGENHYCAQSGSCVSGTR